jgi:hypothetical protein
LITAAHGTASTAIKVSCSIVDDAHVLQIPTTGMVVVAPANNPSSASTGAVPMTAYLPLPATVATDTIHVRCSAASEVSLTGSTLVITPLATVQFGLSTVTSSSPALTVTWDISKS